MTTLSNKKICSYIFTLDECRVFYDLGGLFEIDVDVIFLLDQIIKR